LENNVFQILIPASGLVSGLIGAYVGLQNRALLAEVRKELAELENRLILRINGTYIRRSECQLKEALTEERLDQLLDELKKRSAAGG
jgi:hypothetical protein